ncbi:CRIB domain-containing protein RIC10-like isoform X2 [Salvia splendens]|uniref:CRIB domain-containing protein RIC10-like isoform X2 n=1 Tax=Salvia splendens TaxID=180675 RepID=UPI001C25820E|nr:CRIB domain-containing protein RIC10-like isoform X2 [Salvia splendens]
MAFTATCLRAGSDLLWLLAKEEPTPFDKLVVLHYLIVHANFFLIRTASQMGTKMKGIYKGVKYSITQMFVKEPELEIGDPTDVKHVAHIGMDGSSGNAPSWMNEYKTESDFAATSLELGESQSGETSMEVAGVKKKKKKERRRKPRSSNSSQSNNGSCSSRPSRQGKPKTKFIEDNAKTTNIQVV